MKNEDTVCYKISRSIDIVERCIATGKLDAGQLANYLHQIRSDATKMESGLKMRKDLMLKHGIEIQYQKLRGEAKTPPGVNTIANKKEEQVHQKLDYEFIVKEKGEVVYQNKVFAGVMSVVEKISDINDDGEIEGVTQKFFFGHDIAMWFAFDQLIQSFEDKKIKILQMFRTAAENNSFKDPGLKKKILDLCNNIV